MSGANYVTTRDADGVYRVHRGSRRHLWSHPDYRIGEYRQVPGGFLVSDLRGGECRVGTEAGAFVWLTRMDRLRSGLQLDENEVSA